MVKNQDCQQGRAIEIPNETPMPDNTPDADPSAPYEVLQNIPPDSLSKSD